MTDKPQPMTLRTWATKNLAVDHPPGYPSLRQWLRAGVERQPYAVAAAILAGWGLLWLAVFLAALGAIAGAIAGYLGSAHFLGSLYKAGAGGGIGTLSAIAGAGVGAIIGFLLVYGGATLHTPIRFGVSMVTGALLALGITYLVLALEPRFAQLRGYRRLSRREREKVEPLLTEAGERMGLSWLPPVYMSDTVLPNAWAHMRYIVITKGALIVLEPDELSGVLAHELQHWSAGDVVALRFIWACAWPVAISVNVLGALTKKGQSFIGQIAWVALWPAWFVTRFIIVPLTAARGRDEEYQADAAAAAAGYGDGLRRALMKMAQPEAGRTGWETALAKTHPPVELRLEALENPPPAPAKRPPADGPEPEPTSELPPIPAPDPIPQSAAGAIEVPVPPAPGHLWTPERHS